VSSEAIALENVTKRFDKVTALNGISLAVRDGEFFSLLGPSGCGKTTLLRLIAGLEDPDEGKLNVCGVSMLGIPPQRRPVNTVFQNYALFPHLNVFDNVAFGLRMRRMARPEIARRVNDALELTAIADLRDRLPNQLSGGQKQRVALARALVNEPSVLLLDEPLAAVDAKLRAQLQADLKSLQRRLGTTFLYVTHDQDEALALSDRVAVLSSGRVAQCGTPAEIYEKPANRFVASFLGGCNILTGRVVSAGSDRAKIETPAGILEIPAAKGELPSEVLLGIRREKIRLLSESEAASTAVTNVLRGRIVEVSYTGPETQFSIEIENFLLRGWIANDRDSAVAFGETRQIQLPRDAILLLKLE
jgi:spermidine/putrescine transport system ATP-binding protein